jgi:hypothetical protein
MEISKIINVIIVVAIICILWWIIVWLLKKLLKPHEVIVHGKSTGKSTGLIYTGKNSSGETAVIVDESISDNREVGEILRINKNLKVAIRNVLLIDNRYICVCTVICMIRMRMIDNIYVFTLL